MQVLVRFGGQICDLLQTIRTAPAPAGNYVVAWELQGLRPKAEHVGRCPWYPWIDLADSVWLELVGCRFAQR